MATKRGNWIVVLIIMLSVVLAACAAPDSAELTETAPAATESSQPTEGMPEADETATSVPPSEAAGSNLRPITVEGVQVEIGEGSPIPAEVVVSGTWPDLCAQVARVEQRVVGSRFEIELLATPAQAECPPDYLGLPFHMAIPLNVVELPGGTYSISVNGVETAIAWDFVPASGGVTAETPAGDLRTMSVAAVTVEVGVGSPIPVEVVASGDWPSLCSQLAEINQQVSGERIEISLLATPDNPDCLPDQVGVPFRVAVPLNMVEMPLGTYTIVVNGVETIFEWTGSATEQSETEAASATLAYIGLGGNLWVIEQGSSQARQITQDGTPENAEWNQSAPSVRYYFPKISSDGRYLAVRRDAGTPVESGMQYEFGLWVYDTQSGEPTLVLADAENPAAGFDWKPGTYQLAYGLGVDMNYFTTRGSPDPALATGIYGWDLASGESSLLVEPERGYSLMLPVWSPDGRYLSFDEVWNIEGRGMFAYYDFEAGQYISWEEPIGNYDWSPDGSQIVYDRLTYTPTGEERIYVRAREVGDERQVSPDMEQSGYAFFPTFSPIGEQIAYLANLVGPDSMQDTLFVQDLAGGEPRDLGVYESALYPQWAPDSSYVIFSAGPYEAQQILQVAVGDGTSVVLAEGSQLTVAVP